MSKSYHRLTELELSDRLMTYRCGPFFLTFKGKHALKIELKFNPALPKTSDPPIASSFDGLKGTVRRDVRGVSSGIN
jgi:hypothetical protein